MTEVTRNSQQTCLSASFAGPADFRQHCFYVDQLIAEDLSGYVKQFENRCIAN